MKLCIMSGSDDQKLQFAAWQFADANGGTVVSVNFAEHFTCTDVDSGTTISNPADPVFLARIEYGGSPSVVAQAGDAPSRPADPPPMP